MKFILITIFFVLLENDIHNKLSTRHLVAKSDENIRFVVTVNGKNNNENYKHVRELFSPILYILNSCNHIKCNV